MAFMKSSQEGGTLINSTSKLAVALLVSIGVVCGCSTSATKSAKECVQTNLKGDVVRIDEINHRYFVVPNEEFQPNSIQLDPLSKCFKGSPWKNDWSVSVFSEAKYAGYQDEAAIIPFHKDNQWAQAYLAEIDGQSLTISIDPLASSL